MAPNLSRFSSLPTPTWLPQGRGQSELFITLCLWLIYLALPITLHAVPPLLIHPANAARSLLSGAALVASLAYFLQASTKSYLAPIVAYAIAILGRAGGSDDLGSLLPLFSLAGTYLRSRHLYFNQVKPWLVRNNYLR